MDVSIARQWMYEQLDLGRQLYLFLDCDALSEARLALLGSMHGHQYVPLYINTPVAELADVGPAIFQLNSSNDPAVDSLIDSPESDWGWIASAEINALAGLVKHWHDRLVVGQRPQQALYRFHDNRILARALSHLQAHDLPAYLGPIASLCYWQGSQWMVRDNPAPGDHSVPADPAWLNLPDNETNELILQDNLHRYLVAEHTEAYSQLALAYEPSNWLKEQLSQARTWGWNAPEQLHLLITQSLYATDNRLPEKWQPNIGETSQAHFERLRDELQICRGDAQS